MFSQEEQQAKFKEEKIRIAMEKLREARIKKVKAHVLLRDITVLYQTRQIT
jgi:hypothetical protein